MSPVRLEKAEVAESPIGRDSDAVRDSYADLTFSLSAIPNMVWGTAESSAPPSFGTGSSAVTVNVSPATVAIAPGTARTVTVDAQRMIDGPGDYTITATSSRAGITAAPVSGQFAADGSGTGTLAITVAQAVPGYYGLALTTTVGASVRTSTVVVAVGQAASDSA